MQTLGDRRNMVGEELEARLVKMVCKRAAIKAGQQLSVIEMRELVRQLEECQAPHLPPRPPHHDPVERGRVGEGVRADLGRRRVWGLPGRGQPIRRACMCI
ncbi:MAG: hypothetical protein R3A10_18365 [Caldilineaceae bacterium]